MAKSDVVVPTELKGQLLALLKSELSIEVAIGGFTDPNSRTIVVKFSGQKVAEATFDVADKPEYSDW